ncbi:FtsX-like permease family protein [Streptosporangium subroseum]|uniref:FtsX-like permease family protein n=1 Tax=Streptosporangium subroseum TaxID=106412 RepID=UPI003085D402|nr:FtsX-like permease family protein [Streptosporangium subroseum]
MARLAVRTARAHPGSYVVSALVMTAGTALLTAFASLLETGLSTGRDSGFLIMLPAILGGWTVAIVAFGVVSTVSLTVQHRERELALLRLIAATPRQIRRIVMLETLVAAVPGVVAGLLPGVALGAIVLGRLVDAGLVGATVELRAGWLCAAIGAGTSLLAAVAAAAISSRRAASVPPARALMEAAPSPARNLSRARVAGGFGLLALGMSLATATLFMADGPLLSSTAGPAGVAVAVGLALLGPIVIRPIGRLTQAGVGATARLAARNLHAGARQSGSVLSPLILLVGIAAGTLYMQSTEDSTHRTTESTQLAPVNYLVVTMIIGFTAIVVINTLVATTRARRREFGLLRLTAATRGQVLGLVAIEAVLTSGIAVVLGTVAAAATTVPYSLVKTGSPIASGPPWMYVAIAGGAFLLALLAALPTAMGALRVRPIVAATAM